MDNGTFVLSVGCLLLVVGLGLCHAIDPSMVSIFLVIIPGVFMVCWGAITGDITSSLKSE